MAEDIASLLLEVKSNGVQEGIDGLIRFKDAAIGAEEGAQQLVQAAQELNVTVPLLKVAISQAIDDGDSARVEELSLLVRDLGNAYQVAGVTGAQKMGELREATQAVADAIKTIGSGNLAAIDAFNSQIENMAEAFADANKQATLFVAGAIRQIGKGETAQIQQFTREIQNMGTAFEAVNKQAQLFVAGAIRQIGRGNAAQIEQFNAQMGNMNKAFQEVDETATIAVANGIRQFGKGIEDTDDTMKGMLPTMSLFRYYMAFEIARAFVDMASNVLESGEKLREFAETAGLTTDAFQRLSYSALQVGIDAQKFNTFFDFLDRAIGAAEHGAPAVVHAFADMGISVDDLFKKRPEEIFYRMSDAMAKMSTAQKELALTQLGGRGGKQFGALFGPEGSAGIKRTGEDAVILTKEDIQTSEDYTKSARSLWNTVTAGVEKGALAIWRWRQANVDAFSSVGIGGPSTLAVSKAEEAKKTPPSGPAAGSATDNPVVDYTNQSKDLIATMHDEIVVEREKAAAEREGGIAVDLVTGKIKAKTAALAAGLPLNDPKVMEAMAKSALEYATAMNAIKTNRNFRTESEELTVATEAEQAKTSALGLSKEATDRAMLAADRKRAVDKLGADATLEDKIAIGLQSDALGISKELYDRRNTSIAESNRLTEAELRAVKDLTERSGDLASAQRRVADELGLAIQAYDRGVISLDQLKAAYAGATDELKKKDWVESAKSNADLFIHTFDTMSDSLYNMITKTEKGKSAMDRLKESALSLAREGGKFAFDTLVTNPARHAAEGVLHPAFPNLVPGPPDPNAGGKNGSSGGNGPDPNNPFGGGTGLKGLFSPIGSFFKNLFNFGSPSAPGGAAGAAPGAAGAAAGTGGAASAASTVAKTVSDEAKNATTEAANLVKQTTINTTSATAATQLTTAATALQAAAAALKASASSSSGGAGGIPGLSGGGSSGGSSADAAGQFSNPGGVTFVDGGASTLGASASRTNSSVIGSHATTSTKGSKASMQHNSITIMANDAGSFHASKRQTMADLSKAIKRK